jgi:hypothetical protein
LPLDHDVHLGAPLDHRDLRTVSSDQVAYWHSQVCGSMGN